MTNEQLVELIDERLIAEGYTNPSERNNLFLHEVYAILYGGGRIIDAINESYR